MVGVEGGDCLKYMEVLGIPSSVEGGSEGWYGESRVSSIFMRGLWLEEADCIW